MRGYDYEVGHYRVRLPWHPDDLDTAAGVLVTYLPGLDPKASTDWTQTHEALVRALVTLQAATDRRYENEVLEPQHRYEVARGGAK